VVDADHDHAHGVLPVVITRVPAFDL
jgi:hypothetical protein